MKITVTMTAEEFEEFRTFQKDNNCNKNRYDRFMDEMRTACNDICNGVLRSIKELKESSIEAPLFSITNPDGLAKTLDLIGEWLG